MNSGQNLPDPDHAPKTDVVIYDGHCQFCQAQVRNLARFDSCGKLIGQSGKLSFISLHDPRVGQRFPDLSHEQLMEQMYVIDQRGRRHGGADAVRYLSRRLPALWLAMPVLHIPGSANVWRWMYRQIASQRYRWNKESCENDACSVHLGPRK